MKCRVSLPPLQCVRQLVERCSPLGLVCIFGACGEASEFASAGDATDPLGVASSAVLIYDDGANFCEDKTSGGGQQVIGYVFFQPASTSDGTVTWRAEVRAENWKKNIGWNKKRTTELSFGGSLTLFAPAQFMQHRDVYMDTGGELTAEISDMYYFDPIPSDAVPYLSGTVTFNGRDGTQCTL